MHRVLQTSLRSFIYKICLSGLTVFHLPFKIKAIILETSFAFFERRHKNLKLCQQEQTREKGDTSSAIFCKLKGGSACWGKFPDYRGSMGKFVIKNAVLEVLR